MLHVICTPLRPGHLTVRVGDSLWRSEEIVTNLVFRLSMQLLLLLLSLSSSLLLLLLLSSLLLLSLCCCCCGFSTHVLCYHKGFFADRKQTRRSISVTSRSLIRSRSEISQQVQNTYSVVCYGGVTLSFSPQSFDPGDCWRPLLDTAARYCHDQYQIMATSV